MFIHRNSPQSTAPSWSPMWTMLEQTSSFRPSPSRARWAWPKENKSSACLRTAYVHCLYTASHKLKATFIKEIITQNELESIKHLLDVLIYVFINCNVDSCFKWHITYKGAVNKNIKYIQVPLHSFLRVMIIISSLYSILYLKAHQILHNQA